MGGDEALRARLFAVLDNVCLLTPELLSEVGRLVVESGHTVAKKNPGERLRGRCDSFVVETDVHYPTDVSLLWDALRCLLREQGGQRYVISYTYSYHAIHVVMALNIRNAETERLAAELALLTGQTKTEAVTDAIRNHLERLRREQSGRTLADELDEIGRQCAKLPARDGRLADEILGYDEHGLPR